MIMITLVTSTAEQRCTGGFRNSHRSLRTCIHAKSSFFMALCNTWSCGSLPLSFACMWDWDVGKSFCVLYMYVLRQHKTAVLSGSVAILLRFIASWAISWMFAYAQSCTMRVHAQFSGNFYATVMQVCWAIEQQKWEGLRENTGCLAQSIYIINHAVCCGFLFWNNSRNNNYLMCRSFKPKHISPTPALCYAPDRSSSKVFANCKHTCL